MRRAFLLGLGFPWLGFPQSGERLRQPHGGAQAPRPNSSWCALRATEVIFATHESSRRRGRVDLPLPAGRCAMLEMVASGELKVG